MANYTSWPWLPWGYQAYTVDWGGVLEGQVERLGVFANIECKFFVGAQLVFQVAISRAINSPGFFGSKGEQTTMP